MTSSLRRPKCGLDQMAAARCRFCGQPERVAPGYPRLERGEGR